jgi:TRAP-type mannitol/chloroaromatic compound transport system substrate-binding protein
MKKVDSDLKKIVMETIKTYDVDSELLIGNYDTFSRDDLLKEVSDESEIGKEIMEIQSNFLKDLVSGKIYNLINQ